MKENKELFCRSLCETLRLTSCAGAPENNPLVELKYIQTDDGTEIVRPIFADGNGKNGYYDVVVTGDSCMGILYDVCKHFVFRMW